MSRQHPNSSVRIIRGWLTIAFLEVLVALGLVAIAPVFLNSHYPLIGFLLWLLVIVMLTSSSLYLAIKLRDAQRARQLFVNRFPKYAYLTWRDFLELRPGDVAANLEMLEAAEADPDLQALQVSLIELLRRTEQR